VEEDVGRRKERARECELSRLRLSRGPLPPPGRWPAAAAATGGGLRWGAGYGGRRPPCRLESDAGSLWWYDEFAWEGPTQFFY